MVYDLGGGTFDDAIVEKVYKSVDENINDGKAYVKKTETEYKVLLRDERLIGGNNFDELLAEYIIDEIKKR